MPYHFTYKAAHQQLAPTLILTAASLSRSPPLSLLDRLFRQPLLRTTAHIPAAPSSHPSLFSWSPPLPRARSTAMMSSSSDRLNSPGTMAPVASDVVDFGYAPMHSSYTNFDPAPLLQHHHLYDNFDYTAANAFQFQDPFALFSSGSPLTNQLHQSFAPQITMPPMAPSSLLQAPTTMTALPGVPSVVDTYQHTFMGGGGGGFLKREDGGLFFSDTVGGDGGGRIGLNLGRRTYFSPADVLAVDRLLMRSRLGGIGVLGLGLGAAHHPPPRCQAEGCKADLSAAKHYHRRHKVCEYHAKAATVAASGKQQRFCQQCSRFHVLAEFDEAKRSCRKRLTEHNRRRRKPAGEQGKDTPLPPSKKADTSSYNGDHRTTKSSTAAPALSPTTSGFSCLQQQQHELDNGGQSSNTTTAPTALSLAAPPPPVHGRGSYGPGLDTMLLHQQGRDEREQGFMMTSLMQSHQQQQRDSGHILSCSTTSASDQRHQNDGDSCSNGNNMQHFFEVDFM